jgi:hypothetical protein
VSLSISRPGVVVPVRIDDAGLTGPTTGQARGPRWRRAAPGWYVPTSAGRPTCDQRLVEAVVGCGAGAAVTGWGALAWAGGRWFGGLAGDGQTPLPVPVALGDQRTVRPRAGVEISEDWLFPDDLTELDGLPMTLAERSVTYEARRAPSLLSAVRVIDMAAADDLVDLATLAAYTERLVDRPGVRLLRTALGWADENVWSPQEVTMRLRWRRELPAAPIRCNAPLFGPGDRHLLTPDLFDPESGVAGEYDGAIHLENGPRRRDLDRDSLYRDLGIELVTMMSADNDDITSFLARLRGAYRRAEQRRGSARSWTLEQPAWWVDTSTVARRRALDDAARSIWLRRRAS